MFRDIGKAPEFSFTEQLARRLIYACFLTNAMQTANHAQHITILSRPVLQPSQPDIRQHMQPFAEHNDQQQKTDNPCT